MTGDPLIVLVGTLVGVWPVVHIRRICSVPAFLRGILVPHHPRRLQVPQSNDRLGWRAFFILGGQHIRYLASAIDVHRQPERARQADWAEALQPAGAFAAELES
jgi:hypothetical protein